MTAGPARTPLRVAVFVGTRADLGPLSPVLATLDRADDVDLWVLTGVAFSADDLTRVLPDTRTPEAWQPSVVTLDQPIASMSVAAMLTHGPRLSAGAAEQLERLRPSVLVVLGDRWELLYVVPAAFLAGVPIVHLHGGEVTEGAVDERVRHAVSKLADQHCVASPDAAQRLLQMGEPAERVHHTGAPGLDRLAQAQPLSEAELERQLGRPVTRPLGLFTYHPPTAEAGAPVGHWAAEALAGALEHCGTVVATYPGMDAGRDEIIEVLQGFADDPRVILVEGLGARYPGILASADVVVGNSSSGIIEAATVHAPAVNVGDRQLGRLRGENVIDTAEGRAAVAAAVAKALSPDFTAIAQRAPNPYGDGTASARILDIVRTAPASARVKPFHDIRDRTEEGV